MIPEIKKILYGTDFSHNSSYAFLYALDLAQRRGAKIVILHVVPPVPPDVMARLELMGDHQLLEKFRVEAREEDKDLIQSRVQDFCQKMEGQIGASCSIIVSKIKVSFGHPVDEILKSTDEEACDVIVLGNHGKGFLSQSFLGSVAGGVLNRSRKPVLVIPLPSAKDDNLRR